MLRSKQIAYVEKELAVTRQIALGSRMFYRPRLPGSWSVTEDLMSLEQSLGQLKALELIDPGGDYDESE